MKSRAARPKSPASAAVVVPTWNGRRMLVECLDALRAQEFRDFEVRVVDNASTDGSVRALRRDFPEVRVIALRRNLGFTGAVNAGIRAGTEPLVATLNNDARPRPEWLGDLVGYAAEDARAGLFASLVLEAEDPDTVDSAGLTLGRDGTPRCLFRGESEASVPREPTPVLGASAAAALYRRRMLDDIGLFDERFFAYGEDVDLSLRAQLAGHRCMFVPSARVLHVRMGTARRMPALVPYLHYRNTVLYLAKNMPVGWLARRAPKLALSGLRPLLFAPWRVEGWAIMLARFGILRHMLHALSRRQRVRRKSRVEFEQIERLLD